MEIVSDIVIVGAGISGLATALALHRLGIKCLVLESADILRAAGITITVWTNAWRALDALGLGDSLRKQHDQLVGICCSSLVTGDLTSNVSLTSKGKYGDHEVRCVKRKVLLEALAKELPSDTIRYSSKVFSIEESGSLKLVFLADGSTLKTKVLIGCDGVNLVVAKWLGFKKPALSGRSAIRGFAYYEKGHRFEPKFQLTMGNDVRYAIVPCDDNAVYWFLTWSPSAQDHESTVNSDIRSTLYGVIILQLLETSYVSYTNKGKHGDHEVRYVSRKALLEALANELPNDTIRYSSKVASIEESGLLKLVHLADGSTLKAKVLLGFCILREGHGFEPKFVLSKLGKVPDQIRAVIEDTKIKEIVRSPLGYRPPLEILFGNISKDNVCVACDACHPLTPDLGQGGCSALEDGVILARCLADALVDHENEDQHQRIKSRLLNYAKMRRW